MSEQRGGRLVVDREIDAFSIAVLRYDRKNPQKDQRTPGEILEEVEERMVAAKSRSDSFKKWFGALLLSIVSAICLATITTFWPSFLKLLGH